MQTLGEQLIQSAASKDFGAAASLLSADVEFRALTPMKLFEANGPEEVQAILELWYTPAVAIEALESSTVVDRRGVHYRVRLSEGQETFVFEQQAYYDVTGDRISRIHIVCSGDRPVDA